MTSADADLIVDVLASVTEPLHKRIAALEAEIRDLRAKAAAPTGDTADRLRAVEAALGIRTP